MQKYYTLILFTLCFICAAMSENIKIGTVSVSVSTNAICISNSGDIIRYEYNPLFPGSEYYFILTDPFNISFYAEDGVISPSDQLIPITNQPLQKSDFHQFSFFTSKPTTIGFLFGSAGASGGSSQEMIFMDTASDKHVVINMGDMTPPLWINKTNYPPAYVELCLGYKGCRADMRGKDDRIDKVFSFIDGAYKRDLALEKQMCELEFKKLIFTAPDIVSLMTQDCMEADDNLVKRLVDFIHYGNKAGHEQQVNALVSNIHPDYGNDSNAYSLHMGCQPDTCGNKLLWQRLDELKAKSKNKTEVRALLNKINPTNH